MSNWGGQPKAGSGGDWLERSRGTYLVVVTVALLVLAGILVVADRYQIDQAGGLPTRLDRFTGQVIACVPQRGCVEFIPAGAPTLNPVIPAPKAGMNPAQAPVSPGAPAAAAPASTAPAAAAPSPAAK